MIEMNASAHWSWIYLKVSEFPQKAEVRIQTARKLAVLNVPFYLASRALLKDLPWMLVVSMSDIFAIE